MPPSEVGEAYVAIRAIATDFRQQAESEVNAALTQVREQATVPIRAQVDTTSANRVRQSFQPVVAGAQRMGSEVQRSYGTVGSASHSAFERVTVAHDGIRARFGETLRAASAMGGGIALAYGAYSQVRQALQSTNELAHATNLLSTSTGLNAKQASEWISVAQAQGVQSTSLQTAFNSLSRVTSKATDDFAKGAAAHAAALAAVHTETIRVAADQQAYQAAVAKSGAASSQATGALATLSSAHATLQTDIEKTSASLGGNAAAFDQLGISQRQLEQVQGNLPAELALIADKMQQMGAGTDRSRVAQALFGRSYAQLLPLFSQGAAGIQKNIDIADQYGATLSGPTLDGMEKLRREQQQLSLEMTGLRVRIATALEPVLINLGLKAVAVGSQVGTAFSKGIGLAKQVMDNFLRTPYGQGLSAIAGDATRFAGQVRARFEHDLSRPLAFGRLFDNFVSDMEHWLPGAAKSFWTQLNQDLFAPGQLITVPVKLQPQQQHAAQIAPMQLTGAGIFPGQNWAKLGEDFGNKVVDGMISGLKGLSSKGGEVIAIVGGLVGDVVDWIVNGGGAARILSGALAIADAFVNVIFDPRFWIANWKPIVDLALVAFSDGFATVGKEALGRLAEFFGPRMIALLEHFAPEWIKVAYDVLRRLPDIIGQGILDVGIWIGDHLPRVLRPAIDFIFSWLADVPARVLELLGKIPDGITKLFEDFRSRLGAALDVGFIGNSILNMLQFIARISVADYFRNIGRNIVVGIGDGIWGAAGWLENQVVHFIGEFVNWVEGELGISSPSTVAHGWGSAIVDGLVNGLRSMPGAVLNIISRLPGLVFGVLSRIISGAASRASDLVHAIVDPISNLPGKFAGVWSDIQGTIASGWRGIVSTLEGWVNKLLSPVNSVLGFLHLPKIPTFSQGGVAGGASTAHTDSHGRVHKMEMGGIVPGPNVNRDIVPALLTPGEIVLNRSQQDMLGGHAHLVNLLGFGSPQGGRFAGGGLAGGGGNPSSGNVLGSIAGAVGGALSGAVGMITDPLGWLKSHLPSLPSAPGVAGEILHGLASYVKDKVLGWISNHLPSFTGGGGGPGITPTGSAAIGANQALGLQMMLAHGWPASQWGALQALWTRESGWNQFARNASSGAYGIPQSLPASKMASAGADWLTNPATQIRWGLDYIAGRYGSPGGAWAHEESAGWYHRGGVVPGGPTQNVPIMAQGGEVVFRSDQLAALRGMGGITIHQLTITGHNGGELADDFLNEIANRTRA